jgi:hypothetical protein
MARIPLQSDNFAEVFCKARDADKPASQAELRHLAAARELAPPSKAHLKRNARAKAGTFVEPIPQGKQPSEATLLLRAQREWYKRQMADLGGDRTIAPSDTGVLYNAVERGLLNYVEPREKADRYPTQAEMYAREDKALADERRKLDEKSFRDYQDRLHAKAGGYSRAMAAALDA